MYNVAIIGCGQIAGGYQKELSQDYAFTHISAYNLCQQTQVIAVSDVNKESAKAFAQKWDIANFYDSLEDLLKENQIDIVSLCTPVESRLDLLSVISQNQNIKAVFCEKPIAQSFEQAQKIAGLLKNKVFALNYFRRWNPDIQNLKQKFSQKSFGEPVKCVVRYTKGMLGNASHLIDLMLLFFGMPVSTKILKADGQNLNDPKIDFVLTYPNNFEVYFLSVPHVDYVFIDVDFLTTNQRIVISQRGQEIQIYDKTGDTHYSFPILKQSQSYQTQWQKCVYHAVEDIVDCIKNKKSTKCGIDDALQITKICEQILTQNREVVSG